MASGVRLQSRVAMSAVVAVMLATLMPVPTRAAAPTEAPSLTAPLSGATVSGNPVLTWTKVLGAARYRVQVSQSAAFASLAYSVDTVNVRATPTADLPEGPLYWRVAATDGGSGVGPWATGHFTKEWGAAPNPTAPAHNAVLSFPTSPVLFRWDALQGARTYTLEVDDAPDFIGAATYQTNNSSFTLTEPQTVGQVFHWRVRGNAAAGVVSAWSETRSYTYAWPGTPVLVSPPNTNLSPIEDVNLVWQPVAGAAAYQLQVSPNGDWANNVTIDRIVLGTRYSPPTTILNGAYFWRVRAKDARTPANNGPWSAEWTFTRGWADVPVEVAPAWNEASPLEIPVVGVPTLRWTPVDHASYYEVWIGPDVNFSPGSFVLCYTNRTEVTPYEGGPGPGGCTVPVKDDAVLYWKVRGIDGGANVLGLWSASSASNTYRFMYRSGRTTLLGPGDGLSVATVATPVLRWSPVDNVEKYRVTIVRANGTVAKTVDTYATSYTPDSLTPSDGPFSWYVRTIDGSGNVSSLPAQSDWWSFSLTAPSTTTAFSLLAPADGSSHVRMPSMQWEPYTGASYYKVWYGPAGGLYFATPLSGSTQLKFAAFTYAGLPLAEGLYKWYVEAFNSSNVSLGVSAQQTFAMEPPLTLGSADYLTPARCLLISTCQTVADTPTLTWNAVPGAGAYQVIVANDANFTNQVVVYKTIFTRLTPRSSFVDSQAGQAYYWFVRPCIDWTLTRCGPSEQTSANANAGAFRKRSAAVELTGPAADATVPNQVTFTWRDYLATNGALSPAVTQGARSYRIAVSTVADFSSVLDTQVVDQTTYTPFDITYPEGPLYWRVQALDQSGNSLTVSPSRRVTKASPAPALTFPANGATVSGVPYLSWTPQLYAARYNVEVYRGGDLLFSPANRVLTQTTKFAAWAPTTSLPSDVYAWRVQRIDANSRVGPWSAGRTFRLQAAAPALISPADGTAFASKMLFFSWGSVPGAAQYRFEASTTSGFTTTVSLVQTVMTAWAPTTAFADGSFFWRVSALDAAGNVISRSTSRSFSVDASSPTVTSKGPLTSPAITDSFTVTFSEPVRNVTTSTFRIVLAGTSTSVAATVSTGGALTTTATLKPSAPLVPGQSYTISLIAAIQDAAGNSLVPVSWTVRASLVVDQTSVALAEVWDRDASTSASGGAYAANRLVGSSASFTFSGTTVSLLGRKAPDGGRADVYLDGVRKATLDFYRSTTQWKAPMWSASGLAAGTHTVKVVVLGTRQAASTGTWVYLDAFVVGAVSHEETSASIRQAFRRVSTSSAFDGSYDTVDHVASGDSAGVPTYRLRFRGTDLVIYGTRSPASGRATVYIDGVSRGTIDLYSASTAYKVTLFDSPALTDGLHTLEIRATGTKATASKGTQVALDRIVLK